MNLKVYIQKSLREQNNRFQEIITCNEEALESLKKMNVKRAHYTVNLYPYRGGEKSVALQTHGTLERAIHEAEKEFKEKNRCDDVQARYRVTCDLGTKCIFVPDEYWKKYVEKK